MFGSAGASPGGGAGTGTGGAVGAGVGGDAGGVGGGAGCARAVEQSRAIQTDTRRIMNLLDYSGYSVMIVPFVPL